MTFNYKIVAITLFIAVLIAMMAVMINVCVYLSTPKKKDTYTEEISPEYIKNKVNAIISIPILIILVSTMLYLEFGFVDVSEKSNVRVHEIQKLTDRDVTYNDFCHTISESIHGFKENNGEYRDCIYELVVSTTREYDIFGLELNITDNKAYRTLYTSADLCKMLMYSTGNLYVKEGSY